MFKILFSPQYSTGDLTLVKLGDILNVNGDELDFSLLSDGGEYPPEAIDNEFVIGGVKRVDGEIHITIILPYNNLNAPRSVTFPEPITVSVDGPVALPDGRTIPIEGGKANAD